MTVNGSSTGRVTKPGLARDVGRWPISSVALVAANLIPLGGVVFFGWDVFTIMFLFWMENVVVGVFNVLRMAVAWREGIFGLIYKVFLIPFFVFHYGMFALAHGVFVFAIFKPEFFRAGDAISSGHVLPWGILFDLIGRYVPPWTMLALGGLAVSHGVSFVSNFIVGGEFRRVDVDTLMMAPYSRVILLHLTLLGGGFIMLTFGAPQIVVALLVVLKIAMDLHAHVKERKKLAAAIQQDGGVRSEESEIRIERT